MSYKVQIDDIIREATSEETARIDELKQGPTLEQRFESEATVKASARTKLAAVGLTEAEIAALIGA